MKTKLFISALLLSWVLSASAQIGRPLPVLQSNPDARTAAMGGATGAKTDRMYLFSSPSAMLFQGQKLRFDFSTEMYPKVQDITGRTMQYNLTGAYHFLDRHAAFLGFRYQGGTEHTYIDGNLESNRVVVKPFNWIIDAGYAFKLSEQFSVDASANLIASWIGKGSYTGSFALGVYYQGDVTLGYIPAIASVGLRVMDIGAPLSYKAEGMSYALPTSLQLSGGLDLQLTPKHQVNLLAGTRYFFLPKEASLFTMGLGTEYGYKGFLFARAGFQYGQHAQSFGTLGLGGKYQGITLDAAYRISTAKDFGVNTLLISLGYSF